MPAFALIPVLCGVLALVFLPGAAAARKIGSVDTAWKIIGPNHKIEIEAFEDPKIGGLTCFISRAVKGGLSGAVGVAEETSDASITCHQTGPVRFLEPIDAGEKGEEVFNERRSILFKALHVTRFYDPASRTLVYLTWSDKLIEGSPQNSISAVTMRDWGAMAPDAPRLKPE